jgi:hypothetical protein
MQQVVILDVDQGLSIDFHSKAVDGRFRILWQICIICSSPSCTDTVPTQLCYR